MPPGKGAGQPNAVELIELFYDCIYGFLRRLTGNDADAADLAQRTFSRVCQKLAGYVDHSSPGSWIHSIAYHLYVDWRRTLGPIEERSDEWWAAYKASEPGPDEMVARDDLHSMVFRFVDELSPELRETIHLRYYQELTLQETADVMGVALSTVKYRQHQSLEELQKKLNSPTRPLKTSPPLK